MNEKQALTEIPLSPEERYEASNQLGRSLFSALQLAREQEARRLSAYKKMQHGDSGNVLKIPIPESMMPVHKSASRKEYSVSESPEGELKHKITRNHDGLVTDRSFAERLVDMDPAYKGLKYDKMVDRMDGTRDHEFKLEEGKGIGAMLKRNVGKILGTAGGASVMRAMPKSPFKLLLPAAGFSLGSGLDSMQRRNTLENMENSPEQLENMLLDSEFRQKMQKNSSEDIAPSLFGEAMQHINNHPVRMLIGGQQGFRDAKKDFYFSQKEQMQKELMKAQKDYIDVLSRIKTGSAEEATPCVDAFCDGIAHYSMFGKTATFKDVDISDGSVDRLMGDLGSVATRPFKPAIQVGASSLLATGAGSAYLTYLLRKKMREEPDKYMEEQLPTRVELEPYA